MKDFIKFLFFYWIVTNPLAILFWIVVLILGLLSHFWITWLIIMLLSAIKNWLFDD